MQSATTRQRWLDGFAMGASAACLVHCLLLPALLVALPTMAAFLTIPEGFHLAAFALAVPTSLLAMASGYRRHCRLLPAGLAAVGLLLLGTGALGASEAAETILSVSGALVLGLAHALNWRVPQNCAV
jgi:hypothetical protein